MSGNVGLDKAWLLRVNENSGSVKLIEVGPDATESRKSLREGFTHWSERNMSAIDSQTSQIYRGTPIGVALTRSLNAMIVSQQISGATAVKIMVRFLIFVLRHSRRLSSTISDEIHKIHKEFDEKQTTS